MAFGQFIQLGCLFLKILIDTRKKLICFQFLKVSFCWLEENGNTDRLYNFRRMDFKGKEDVTLKEIANLFSLLVKNISNFNI